MSLAALRFAMVPIACAILSCTRPPDTGESAVGTGAAGPPEPVVRTVALAVPGTLNRMPSLAGSDDRVAAVWTSTLNDVMDVYAAVSNDGGATFSEPRRVNDRPGDVRSNAEQPPRVVMSDAAITVIWPSRSGSNSVIRQARSTDGGRTFSRATTLHSASLSGARGWQSLSLGRDGAVHAVWLDGRDADPSTMGHHHHATAKTAAPAPRHEGAPRQDVYQAVIAPDGTVSEAHVARDVCYCCKTAVGIGPSGRVNVAWRHIFPESMRDIAMATSSDGGRTFGPLARISEDRWQLSGCPDDGPSMAVDTKDAAHLVWPTLINQTTPQKAIFYTSTKDGRAFEPRVRLSSDDQEDAAHPQIAVDAAGNVAAVWDEQRGDTRRIVMRRATAGTGFGAPRVLSDGGSAFHPHVIAASGGFLVAWPAGSGDSSRVVVQRLTF
jgi:hypothetical protein